MLKHMRVAMFIMAGVLVRSAVAAPNIVFILADDLGYGDLGCFFQNARPAGKMRLATPELDRMAAEGMMLTHHYTGAPVCVSARACLMTGFHTGHSPIKDNQFDSPLPPDGLTLPRMLKSAGYRTACVGKWGMSGAAPALLGHPMLHGFDEFYGVLLHSQVSQHYPGNNGYVMDGTTPVTSGLTGAYVPDLLVARAKNFIQNQTQNQPGQPFFLYLPLTLPHWYLMHPPAAYPAGSGLAGGMQWPPVITGTPDTYIAPDIASAVYDHDNNPATAMVAWPDNARRYASMIRRMDQGVGDVLQLLRDLNIATNTLVVITSDNGADAAGGHNPNYFDSWGPLDGVKLDLWEGGIREPTIAWWPDTVPANSTSTTPGAFWDWLPTFAEMAHLAPPARDGMSLLPSLTQEGHVQTRSHLYWEFYVPSAPPLQRVIVERKPIDSPVGESQAIRIGDFTGVRYQIRGADSPLLLYDVVSDPHQDVELSGLPAHRPLLRRMQNLLGGSRMVDPFVPRTYDSAAVQSAGLPDQPGLNYKVFEGAWPWIPDFRVMTPVGTGTVTSVTTAVLSRNHDAGAMFEGYLRVPKTADYTFSLAGSGGAFLWVHDAHVIFWTGTPDAAPRTGRIRLEAGMHPVRLHYRHESGAKLLELQYSVDNGPFMTVPPSALFRSIVPNLAPMAFPDTAETPMNTPVTVDVLFNDLDDDVPHAPVLTLVNSPAHGAVTLQQQAVQYTPSTDFLGSDRFTYVISDGVFAATGSVDITVTALSTTEWWLPFEERSGFDILEAGGGKAGVTYGYDTHNGREPGRIGWALRFDGLDDTVFVTGRTPPLGTSARTISAWIRVPANGGGPIFGYGVQQPGQRWVFRVQGEADGTRMGALRVEVENGYVLGMRDLRDDQWHHVACVLPAATTPNINQALLYVDGVPEPVSVSQSREVNTAAGGVYVGSDVQRRQFLGWIDEVRVYPRALSPSELQSRARGVQDTPERWQRRYLPPAQADWQDDVDGDGVPNLWELAAGRAPYEQDDGMRLELDRDESLIRLRCLRDPGILIHAELSGSLSDWSAPEQLNQTSTETDPENASFQYLRFQIPPQTTRGYIRFKAEPAP